LQTVLKMSNVAYWNDDDRRGYNVMKREEDPVDDFDLGVALKEFWQDMNESLYCIESDTRECDCTGDPCCERCERCEYCEYCEYGCDNRHNCDHCEGLAIRSDRFFDIDYCKHMSRSPSHESLCSFRTQSAEESINSHDQSNDNNSDEDRAANDLKEPQRYAYI
jgi:hypothetical protein